MAETPSQDVMQAGTSLALLSEWIDSALRGRGPEAVRLHRITKIGEEFGEVVAALIGASGANPRKGTTHSDADVVEELLDVAVTALGAVEHETGNDGQSILLLLAKIEKVSQRVAS